MFVHVTRTQATLGLSVVFATVAMVRTDRALPCNLFDRRRVLQYAAQVLQYAAFSAAVRARTPGPSAWCCSALHQVLRYAASGAAVRFDHVQSDASSAAVRARTWSGAVSRRSRAAARYYQLMQYQVLQYAPGPSVRRCSTLP